jgi:biotin carboxylase
MTPVEGKESHPQPKNPVQSRWVVYDSPEHEFSVYYDDQEAKKEYEGRIKQINDDVGTDEYDGDEEVYLAQVISKAEVVQVGIADDGDEGLYRLIAYDCASHNAAGNEVEQIEKIISDRIQELKYLASGNCVREALLGENQALWAQLKELRAQQKGSEWG